MYYKYSKIQFCYYWEEYNDGKTIWVSQVGILKTKYKRFKSVNVNLVRKFHSGIYTKERK